jgi:hypothetical protein
MAVLVAVLLLNAACNKESSSPTGSGGSANPAPSIQSVSVNPVRAHPGDKVQISCNASDPLDEPITYQWLPEVGDIDTPTAPASIWNLPTSLPAPGSAGLRLIVSDGNKGDTADIAIEIY